MLKSQFRKKYPCNPHFGNGCLIFGKDYNLHPLGHILHKKGLPLIKDIVCNYCKRICCDYEIYFKDLRSIELINPTTKRFYTSKKYK